MINQKISILLADDHEIFRNGVQQLINNEADMHVVDTVDNGEEAIRKAKEWSPDLILMDISMPRMTGLEAAARLINDGVHSKILLFSLYDRDDYVKQSLKIGVMGYVLKDAPNKVFLKAIRSVADGHYFYSGDLTNVLISEYRNLKLKSTDAETDGQSLPQRHLTAREIEILKQIAEGVGNKELALKYDVSTRTIETHRLNIMRKLQVKQIEAAIEQARLKGMI